MKKLLSSILLSFMILLAVGASFPMEAKSTKGKAHTTASKKSSAGKKYSFKIPGAGTCTLASNGRVLVSGKVKGTWKKSNGAIFVEVDFQNYESDIYAGVIVGDRFYYDYFGSEGCGDESYYNSSIKAVYWELPEEYRYLSQLKSVKVTKY